MNMIHRDIFQGKVLIFIAEIGLNHNGSIETAKKMVEAAAKSGADAVKFQTFIPEKMNSVYTRSLAESGIEKAPDYREIDFFKKFVLSKNDYKELFSLASKLNLVPFSSPFDIESVDLLEDLNVKLYKIASSEVTNHILLKKIAATKKPVIMSTGISNDSEISMAVELLRANGTPDIVLLHCVSLYPLPPELANLLRIASLRERFGIEAGFSDHSKDSRTSEIALALGASVFEKHFKLDGLDCPDKELSLTPGGFKEYTESIRLAHKMLGSGQINFSGPEKEVARLARKSLFAARDIKKGNIISAGDLVPKRPGLGLPVYEMENIIGKTANIDIKKDFILRMEYFN